MTQKRIKATSLGGLEPMGVKGILLFAKAKSSKNFYMDTSPFSKAQYDGVGQIRTSCRFIFFDFLDTSRYRVQYDGVWRRFA